MSARPSSGVEAGWAETAETAHRLGLSADTHDRYSLMAAIQRCDTLVGQIRDVQLGHTQNLCRVANHLAAEAATTKENAHG